MTVANFRVVPDADRSDGDTAVELARSAGLTLDPWQAQVLVDALGRRGGRWSAFDVCLWVPRQNGKGAVLEALELAHLFLFGTRKVLHSAHEFKTASEAFKRVLSLITNTDDLRRRVRKVREAHGHEGVELLSGQELRFVARSAGSGRGFGAGLVVYDESLRLNDAHVAASLPVVLAQPDPQVWYTSTPPLNSAEGAPMFRLRQRAESRAPGRLCYLDYGLHEFTLEDVAAGRVDIDDPELWRRANPAFGHRVTVDGLQALRNSMSAEEFARECLGIWPPAPVTGSKVIPAELWASLADADAPRPERAAFAVHVNRERTWSAIAYAGRRADGMLQVGLVDWRTGTGWVVDRIVDLRQRWDPVAIAIDTRSERLLLDLGKRGIEPSEDPDEPRAGDVVVPTASDTAAAFGLFVDLARAEPPQLRHTDDAPLNTALHDAETRPLAGGATWDIKGPGEVGPLKSVTLAAWAFEARAHLLRRPQDPVGVW